jgi:hypothetical protein
MLGGSLMLLPALMGGRRQEQNLARPGSAADLQSQLNAARRELAHVREQRDILKNLGHPRRTPNERFERVEAMKTEPSILALCVSLDVSASGYYAWQKRRLCPGPRALENQALARQIKELHRQSRQTYGRQKGRYRVQTTDSKHDHPIAPNRLAAAPTPTAPNPIWVGDITCIETGEGWLDLAGILDLYRRKIWAMGPRIDAELVLNALHMTVRHRHPPARDALSL